MAANVGYNSPISFNCSHYRPMRYEKVDFTETCGGCVCDA